MKKNPEFLRPEENYQRMASQENKSALSPNAEKIRDLTEKYNWLMSKYEAALDANEQAAEVILAQADEILFELNRLDPRLKGSKPSGEIPSMEDLENDAKYLSKKSNSKEIIH